MKNKQHQALCSVCQQSFKCSPFVIRWAALPQTVMAGKLITIHKWTVELESWKLAHKNTLQSLQSIYHYCKFLCGLALKQTSKCPDSHRQHNNKLAKKGTHKEALTHTVTVEEFILNSAQPVRLSRLCKWRNEGGPRCRQWGQILFRVLSFPY